MSEPIILGLVAGAVSVVTAAVTALFANRRHEADTRALIDGAMKEVLDRFQGIVREQDAKIERQERHIGEQEAQIEEQDRHIRWLRDGLMKCYDDWRAFAIKAIARVRTNDPEAAEGMHAELPARPVLTPPALSGSST